MGKAYQEMQDVHKSLQKDHVGIPPLTTDEVITSKSEDKAGILSHQFYSVFTKIC